MNAEEPDPRRTLAVSLAVGLATALLFARSVGFGFVEFDDTTILLGHPHLYGQPTLGAGLSAIFFDYFPREEPLLVRDVSWLIDALIFGFQNPLGYHLGNVLFAALNSSLVALLATTLTRSSAVGLGVGVAFVVVPIHVEPIAWVMGRKDLLSTTFMVLALLVQERALVSASRRTRLVLELLVTALTALAVLSKFSAVTFCMVLALHRILRPHLRGDVAPDAEAKGLGAALLGAAPSAVVSVLLYQWYSGQLAAWGMFGRGPAPVSLEHIQTLATMLPVVLWRYLVLLVDPRHYSLSYEYPSVDFPPVLVDQVMGGVATVAFAALLLWTARRRRDLFFYIASFALVMVPYMNLVYIGIWVANRYLYFAIFFLLVPLALVIRGALERSRAARRPAGLLLWGVAMIYALCTWIVQGAWESNHDLWLHEVSVARPTTLAYQALARSFYKLARDSTDARDRGRLMAQAAAVIDRGLEVHATAGLRTSAYYTPALENHSKLYYVRGRLSELGGEPLERQLEHYEAAYRVRRSPLTTRMLADTHRAIAEREQGPTREEQARLALRYFAEHIGMSKNDPAQRLRLAQMLERDYAERFPFLAPEIAAVRAAKSP